MKLNWHTHLFPMAQDIKGSTRIQARTQIIVACIIFALAWTSPAAEEMTMSDVPNPLDAQLVRFSTMLTVRNLSVSETYYVRHFGFKVTESMKACVFWSDQVLRCI